MSAMNPRHFTGLVANTLTTAIAGDNASGAHTNQSGTRLSIQTIQVKLSTGTADLDIYWPDTSVSAPLVIIAHGFLRHRHNNVWLGAAFGQGRLCSYSARFANKIEPCP